MTENNSLAVADTSWFPRAACRGINPEVFFPDPDHPEFRSMQQDAEAVCSTCPVIIPCAQYALDNGEKVGTWGGKSSWGSIRSTDAERYIQRLKLQQTYNQLTELPNSRRKREMIKSILNELNQLKRLRTR